MRYVNHYLWFWKASFDFMEGYNRLWVGIQCIWKGHGFAVEMLKYEKWEKENRL